MNHTFLSIFVGLVLGNFVAAHDTVRTDLPQCKVLFVLDFSAFAKDVVNLQKSLVRQVYIEALDFERIAEEVDIRANVWSIGDNVENGALPSEFHNEGEFLQYLNNRSANAYYDETLYNAIQTITQGQKENVLYAILTDTPQHIIERISGNAARNQTLAIALHGQNLNGLARSAIEFDDDSIDNFVRILVRTCKDFTTLPTPTPVLTSTTTTMTTTRQTTTKIVSTSPPVTTPGTATSSPPKGCAFYAVLDGSNLGAGSFERQRQSLLSITDSLFAIRHDAMANVWLFGDDLVGDPLESFFSKQDFYQMLDTIESMAPNDDQIDRMEDNDQTIQWAGDINDELQWADDSNQIIHWADDIKQEIQWDNDIEQIDCAEGQVDPADEEMERPPEEHSVKQIKGYEYPKQSVFAQVLCLGRRRDVRNAKFMPATAVLRRIGVEDFRKSIQGCLVYIPHLRRMCHDLRLVSLRVRANNATIWNKQFKTTLLAHRQRKGKFLDPTEPVVCTRSRGCTEVFGISEVEVYVIA